MSLILAVAVFSAVVISVLTLFLLALSVRQNCGSGKRGKLAIEINQGVLFLYLAGHTDDLAEEHVVGAGRNGLDHSALEAGQRVGQHPYFADSRHPAALRKALYTGNGFHRAGKAP